VPQNLAQNKKPTGHFVLAVGSENRG